VDDEVLTLDGVAELLKVDRKTIYRMAGAGELPAFKVRGRWRFRRRDVLGWIDAQVATKHDAKTSDATAAPSQPTERGR
jgi:excisionase family DNA binding protein